jgi:hypothetical protein
MTPIFAERAKWWAVEIRFSKRLTESQIRVLRDALFASDTEVGQDGAKIDKWASKWPNEADDAIIYHAVYKIGAPARVRAAPLGRDCASPDDEACDLGSPWGCHPVFTDNDWQTIDHAAVEAR